MRLQKNSWDLLLLLPIVFAISCTCYIGGVPIIGTNPDLYADRPDESYTGVALSESDNEQAQQAMNDLIANAWNWLKDTTAEWLTGWHLNRNRQNILPSGKLVPKTDASPDYVYSPDSDNLYIDNNGLEWKLLPYYLSQEHQPEGHAESDKPYPNKKFVHREGISSSEVILQPPDWSPILNGKLQGTYNYVDTGGIILKAWYEPAEAFDQLTTDPASVIEDLGRDLGHTLVDLIPHCISHDYK